MLRYEERYFKDMTLNIKEIQSLFMCYQMDDKGKWVKGSFGEIPLISLGYWNIKEKKLRNCEGLCNSKDLEILIKSGQTKKELNLTLLHEMIHAYEDELEHAEGPGKRLKEILLLFLYKKIGKQIGYKKADDLLKVITSSFHWYDIHGHSILFALKSLELDIRLHLPYGTIFAYGRTDYFPPIKDH